MFKGITIRPHSSTRSSQSEWTQTLNSELDLSSFIWCLRYVQCLPPHLNSNFISLNQYLNKLNSEITWRQWNGSTQTIILQKIVTKPTYCSIEQISFCWVFAFIHSANLCDGLKLLRFYFRTQDQNTRSCTRQRRKKSSTTHLDEETLSSFCSSWGNRQYVQTAVEYLFVYIERTKFDQSDCSIRVTWPLWW